MSTRSALAGAATTAVLVAALGNSGAVEAARDADSQALALTLTGFPNWDGTDLPGEVIGGIVLRLALALVLVALLCALAGRSRSRGAAFVGGWGALVVAAAASSAAAYAYQVAVVLDGSTLGSSYLDGLVLAINSGASFGLWTGWLVGLAVALVTGPAPTSHPVPARTAAAWPNPAPERRITEPPPPWWAPTHGDDAGTSFHPGPTAFPPGGVAPVPPASPPARPAQMSRDATHELSTASGDPHPSDPDATPAVGMPPGRERRGRADPDATTTMPEGTDRTMPMPRKPD